MKIIAVITARGGSKRIPKKNIKEFFGQPMIKYAIDAAFKSRIFYTVMVSTDDKQIAQIARQYGAELPFMRSEESATDYATTKDVLIEVVNKYRERDIEFDVVCCIYPCVPFLKAETLNNSYKIFLESNADILMPVVRFSYPIQRALRINSSGLLEYIQPEHIRSRSQDLEPIYHDVGMFYYYKTKALFKQDYKMAYIEMKESEIQDIDTEEDWKMAEIKYKILKDKDNYIQCNWD
jgi:N-acylneuraminate cytidylyltransferase